MIYIKQFEKNKRAGLFALILQVVGVLVENINTFIDLRKNSVYYDPNIKRTQNVWDYYFYQPIGLTEQEIIQKTNKISMFRESKYTRYSPFNELTQKEIEDAHEIINCHIRLLPNIQQDILDFYNNNMKDKKNLGLQIRATENLKVHAKGNDIEYQRIFNKIDKHINEYDNLYFMTDNYDVYSRIKSRYNKSIFYESAYISNNGEAIHHSDKFKNLKYAIGKDVLIQTYLLSMCDYNLVMRSNIALYAYLLELKPFEYIDDYMNYKPSNR